MEYLKVKTDIKTTGTWPSFMNSSAPALSLPSMLQPTVSPLLPYEADLKQPFPDMGHARTPALSSHSGFQPQYTSHSNIGSPRFLYKG